MLKYPAWCAAQARLVAHPHRSEAAVSEAVSQWEASKAEVISYYPKLITEDASRNQRALEEHLSVYF